MTLVATVPSSPARIWSAQQRAIFDWFRDARGHLVVRARAGSGKTTTILEGITGAPESRILVAAFNKRIQEELAMRLTNPCAEAKTLHGVGFACVRRYWENVSIASGNKRAFVLTDEVCGGAAPDPIKKLVATLMTKGREIVPHATEVGQLTELAVEFECEPDDEWTDAGWDLGYVEARALEAMALAAAKKPVDGIDFADMLYLPVRNRWLTKKYDLVVVDEAQDMTVTQLEIAQGVCGGRIAVVGDDRQAIYAFRGADSTSLDRLKAELAATELGLTVTYRCGRVIAEAAKQLVPDLEASPDAPEGEIRVVPTIEAVIGVAAPGDFILSRTNAPLAKVAMAFLRAQKRVRIQGRDIGAGLKALVRKLMTGKAAQSIPMFLERLVIWEQREVDRAYKMDRSEQADAIRDKAETLRVLTDGVTGPRELEARLDTLFSDDGNSEAIVCSSVHKAKGLEASRVFVLRPTLYPRPRKGQIQSPARLREEQNIEYVAITRAQSTLVWVEAK
jgi:superfamily I DNA/RNA helicase